MTLFFRLLYLLVATRRRSKLGVLDTGRVAMWVWPGDLDLLWHMNNGRYLTIMDLGRVDFLIRSGLLDKIRQRNWYPVVAALTITYKRPLKLWQNFEMTTRVAGWDERWIYMQQEFHSGGKLAAAALIQCTFRSADGAVPMAELVALSGFTGVAPQIPPAAARLSEFEIAPSDGGHQA
jgi:acyl-CoA thioesterase FadM